MVVWRGHSWSGGTTVALCLLLSAVAPAWSAGIDNKTLDHKLILGYQGWFACPSDGRPAGAWVHWFARRSASSENTTFDMLPDVSDLGADERCATPWMSQAGKPIQLFSSQNEKTVERHFRWMKENGIDGVALQRFVVGLRADRVAELDRVLANVRRGAEANGRVFFVMYDIAGADDKWASRMEDDWRRLEADGITRSPAYLSHRGHPVLAITGIGLKDRPATAESTAQNIAHLREISKPHGGVTLIGSAPAYWRTLDHDALPEPGWAAVYRSYDVISPWTVGRFKDDAGADKYRTQLLAPDLAECRRAGIDYMPVVFPGFSWANLMGFRHQADERHAVSNSIPRRCGKFYWRQVVNAAKAGATMLYGAMFDEVDEGTAMFKIVASHGDAPAAPPFVTLDADGCQLPSDWYLQLAGKASALLRGELEPSGDLPLTAPGTRK